MAVQGVQNSNDIGQVPVLSSRQQDVNISSNAQAAGHQADAANGVAMQQFLSLFQEKSSSNLQAEFASDEPSNSVWINVVNSNTGQVVYKFPPESIRQMLEQHQSQGLVKDVKV